MAGVGQLEAVLKKVNPFFLIPCLLILTCGLPVLYVVYRPFTPFFPIPKTRQLPDSQDLLVFTSYIFTNGHSLDGPRLFVLIPEKGSVYDWHGLLHPRGMPSWTNKQDKVLISTGGMYAGEPVHSYLLTAAGGIQQIEIDGQLSPDGKKIAYTEDFSLFIYDLAAQTSTDITPPQIWVDEFRWSPDSNYIGFRSPEKVEEVFDDVYQTSDTFKLLRLNVNDGSLLSLTDTINGSSSIDIKWSSDSTMLSFTYYSDSERALKTNVIFANGDGTWQFPKSLGQCQPYLYVWLHQDSQLSVLCDGKPTELWVIDTQTSEARQVGELREFDQKEGYRPSSLTWSPDDTRLAFTVVGKDARCLTTYEGTDFCSENIYVFNTRTDTIKKIPVAPWLEGIRDLTWIRISQ